jgi:protoporphyrinogen oxidase
MPGAPVVVLGGGLSGMAAAYALAQAGWKEITLIERGTALGGLAGTFEQDGHFYPLAYHHILHRDRTLLYFLDRIGVLPRVRWRKIRMLFYLDGRFYDLAAPLDFMRFPMGALDKLRFVRLMLRAFAKREWRDWQGRSAAELVDTWGGSGVRRRLFEPLCRLKFDLPSAEVSGAWLGARLHFREGSAPLGYVPETNWTKLLCDELTRLLEQSGVRVRLHHGVRRLHGTAGRLSEAELTDGRRVRAALWISTLPSEAYLRLVDGDATPQLESIRYTAVLSAICATRQRIDPEFYWMNLATLDHTACGIFRLEALNPTIGEPGVSCLNFVTHVSSRHEPIFTRDATEILRGYHDDFRRIFGFELQPFWTHLSRLPLYSPVFVRGYRNPPVRSATWPNLYFAGNFRTFPSIATTGTALGAGLEAAAALLSDLGQQSLVPAAAEAYRLRSMPRG